MQRYEALSSGGKESRLLLAKVLPKDFEGHTFPELFEELFTLLDLTEFEPRHRLDVAWDQTFAHVNRMNTGRQQRVYFNGLFRFRVEDALRQFGLPIKEAEAVALIWMLSRGHAKFAGFE